MARARYVQKKSCENCGKSYVAARSNSRFCTDTCRVAWNRQQKRPDAEKKLSLLENAINQRIEHHKQAIVEKNKKLEEAARTWKPSWEQLIREHELIIRELELFLVNSDQER